MAVYVTAQRLGKVLVGYRAKLTKNMSGFKSLETVEAGGELRVALHVDPSKLAKPYLAKAFATHLQHLLRTDYDIIVPVRAVAD